MLLKDSLFFLPTIGKSVISVGGGAHFLDKQITIEINGFKIYSIGFYLGED